MARCPHQCSPRRGQQHYGHTVNSHINRLRAKLERDPAHPRHIVTVWGRGYKFSIPD